MSESLRILLISENPDLTRRVQTLLADESGLQLIVCSDPGSARRRLSATPTDVLVMHRPGEGITDPETTAFREWTAMCPVVLLMEQFAVAQVAKAAEAGIQDCIPVSGLSQQRLTSSIRLALIRRRKEEALLASEAHYRLFFQRSPAGAYRCTPDGRIVDANQALASMLGYETAEDLKRHSALEFYFDPSEREASLSRFQDRHSVTNSELRLRHRDGSAIWVLESMILLDGEPDAPALIEGTMIDITMRKQLEEALASEQALLYSLMEYLPDSIYFKDEHSRFVRASRACALKLGASDPNHLIGKSDFDFFAEGHAREAFEDEQEMIRTGRAMVAKEELEAWPDGRVSWASTTKMPMRDAKGTIRGTFGVTRDITRIKNDQARIEHLQRQNELLLNSVGEGICGLDLEGIITFVNPAAAQLTGWTVSELIGKRLHDLVHPHGAVSCSGESCPLQHALLDRTHRQHEDLFSRRGGGSFPVEFISNVMRDPSGDPTGAVLAFRDISERREIARMKDEFIAVVSHELRTPLTSIRGALGLLASGRLGTMPENGRRMLQIAASNTDRLVRLINDILDLERIESGRIHMDWEECELQKLLQQSIELMKPMADRIGVQLQLDAVPTTFAADPDRLQQTISNLLSNAIKFSPAGSVVRIEGGERDGSIWISVHDQGRGIPIEHLEKIFERFHQVDKSDSRDKGGTGLGLPICRKIVDQHGGRIWAESQVGAGSSFHVVLPRERPSVELGSAPQPPTELQGLPAMLVYGERCSSIDTMAQQMKKAGYRVLIAASADEAIRHAESEKPGALLVGLPTTAQDSWSELASLRDRLRLKDVPILVFGLPAIHESHDPILLGAQSPEASVDHAHTDGASASLMPDCRPEAAAHPSGIRRILLVEDDLDLAGVLITMFQQHRIETVHARSGREAVRAAAVFIPDLVVLDIGLPEGDGFHVVRGLQQDMRLRQAPLVVYSGRHLNATERRQLRLGPTEFLTKGQIAPEEFERHVLKLLAHWMG